MSLRVAVLASGRGSNMQSLLQKCAAGLVEAQVGLVVTDRPGAACVAAATAAGVPAVVELPRQEGEGRRAYDARLDEVLQAERPDLIVLAGFMRVLGDSFCAAWDGRIINIHPALLPAFRGAHGVRDALRAGAKVVGCTTHFVTADLDGGPIIMQAALATQSGQPEGELAARILRLEHQILPRTVQLIAEGRVHVEAGVAHVAPGPSWREAVEPVPGAVYSEGF